MALTAELISHALDGDDHLPPNAAQALQIFVQDSLAVAIAGTGAAGSADLRAAASAWGHCNESEGARVWHSGQRLP